MKSDIYDNSIGIRNIEHTETALQDIADTLGIDREHALALCIRVILKENSTISHVLQFGLDTIGDQYIAEEFYHSYPELLSFLSVAGCNNEEVLFLAFVHTHPEIMKCKTDGCDGTLVGGCPKMWCDTCLREYFLDIDCISDMICERCVAKELRECTEDSRKKRYRIFTVWDPAACIGVVEKQ